MSKSLITCDCLGAQTIDSDRLSDALGIPVARPCSALCTTQIERAAQALTEGDAVICCAQEAPRFEALAEELGVAPAPTLDLRDRAGWTADQGDLVPKMSALAAEALLPATAARSMDVTSEGLCLILGPADAALAAAEQLKEYLGVTVLLEPGAELPEAEGFDIVTGRLRQASGSLGNFTVTLDALQMTSPGGRDARLSEPRDGGQSICDILLDLRGGQPLFPAPEKREGYLRADPTHAPGVAAAILAASHLVGTFEQPLYVATDPVLCAHSRAEQTGCTRCLDLCPTGAITPNGDHVSVDPLICAGCGACSAVCPSGAIHYDAPPVHQVFQRVQTLAKTYLSAGGTAPRLLVTDPHGAEMVRLSARHGRGLPADVIPLDLPVLNGFGHAEMLAALGAGFASVALLASPKLDRDAMAAQLDLARAMAPEGTVLLLDTADPDTLSDLLFDGTAPSPCAQPVRPLGTRRQITRQAARALNPEAERLPLPEGAPYGAVLVNTDACTLCLSCVSLCPSGALGDNPDRPQLRFQEDACLQCGICKTVCPENAIQLEPQLELTDAALTQQILHEEEPFACVECGALFGVKSTIDKITEKLASHAMFAGEDKLRMIQMCDDCRVNVQMHATDNPFQGGPRPTPRTTDDYLSKRRDH